MDLKGMNEKQKAETRENLIGMLNELNAARVDARDNEIVWIENGSGRRDVIPFGYWRKYESKHAHETGMRLLLADEIEEEEAKVAQSAMLRAEAERLKNADVVAVGDIRELQDQIATLQKQLDKQGKQAS